MGEGRVAAGTKVVLLQGVSQVERKATQTSR